MSVRQRKKGNNLIRGLEISKLKRFSWSCTKSYKSSITEWHQVSAQHLQNYREVFDARKLSLPVSLCLLWKCLFLFTSLLCLCITMPSPSSSWQSVLTSELQRRSTHAEQEGKKDRRLSFKTLYWINWNQTDKMCKCFRPAWTSPQSVVRQTQDTTRV